MPAIKKTPKALEVETDVETSKGAEEIRGVCDRCGRIWKWTGGVCPACNGSVK